MLVAVLAFNMGAFLLLCLILAGGGKKREQNAKIEHKNLSLLRARRERYLEDQNGWYR
jgi:hypothetical protein